MVAIIRRPAATVCLAAVAVGLLSASARALDPEGCLLCHRYRGLARVDEESQRIRLYYVDPSYCDRALGPHARLHCTGCHPRDEVDRIPHREVSKVDCLRTCHLSGQDRLETVFAHDGIISALESSVHTGEILDEANTLLGVPLGDDQSRCLLCHDEPTFRWEPRTWAQQAARIERCGVCHTEELPKDTQYYYWHVYARSRPARSHRDLTRVCATCHSDESIQERFELPEVTASYLASFHGKAMLLGDGRTASCLDCHVAELHNVHLMMSRDTEGSPTSPARLPDTCRSATCHPAAGAAISSAAIHLDLATSRGIEYFIASLFVFLILSTFGPSVLLLTLDLLQVVLGRQDPNHDQHRELAERIAADPRGRRALCRFTPHQRVQHWLLFGSFTLLVLTGFPMKFAESAWAAWIIEQIGSLHRARLIHRWAGVVMLTGFAYHLVYVMFLARAARRRTGRGFLASLLTLPMMPRWRDVKELWQLFGYLLFFRRTRPEAGQFAMREKFEYAGVFWGCALLGATGMLMWFNAWTTAHLTGRVLTTASLIHSFEAFLALLHVGIIHLVGVSLSPSVFPLSLAMFTGDTPADELAEGHAGWVEEAAARLETGTVGGRDTP